MTKRVYHGMCPYERHFGVKFKGDCADCTNFKKCKHMERKRRHRVNQRRKAFAILGVFAMLIMLVIVSMAVAIVTLANVIRDGIKETPQVQKETTVVVETITPNVEANLAVQVVYPEPVTTSLESNTINDIVEVSEKGNTEEKTNQVPNISAYTAGEIYYYNLSYEEKEYIAKVVYAESRGEEFEGQVAVAATVLNRYTSNDKRFNRESIYSVITQSGQYASISGITLEKLNAVPSCMEAVEAACKGWDPTRIKFPDGAKFFFNPDGDLDEEARKSREGIETYRIGSHLFHNDFSN